jgi:hypothetical protein
MSLLLVGNRRRARILRVAILFCLALGVASCETIDTRMPVNLAAPEKMAWSTYPIATAKGLGTCVIVNRRESSAPDGVVPVLVTCAHVLDAAPRGPWFLVLRVPEPGANPGIVMLSIDIPPDGTHPYIKHPRQDIAAMRIDIPPDVARIVNAGSFISENALARQRPSRVGDAVFVLGFPKVFPGTEGAFPVFRGGTIASYSPGSQADKEKYLIHTNVFSGDSGGPVFAARGHGAPQLLGLVSERIGPKTGVVPLAVAVDVSVIRETLALMPPRPIIAGSAQSPIPFAGASVPKVRVLGPPDLLHKILRDGTAKR